MPSSPSPSFSGMKKMEYVLWQQPSRVVSALHKHRAEQHQAAAAAAEPNSAEAVVCLSEQ